MYYQLEQLALVQPRPTRDAFLESNSHVTLVEVELVSVSYTLKQSGILKQLNLMP